MCMAFGVVALRKESVDRNILKDRNIKLSVGSLSARRAWIEISVWCTCLSAPYVALRKESVDRNIFADSSQITKLGRSPQGERG